MRARTRLLLLFEALCFGAASGTHFGLLVRGYEHQAAAIAESTIAAVLVVGLILTLALPVRTLAIALGAQGLALVGTLVGAFTIAVGIGPRTVPDLIFHVGILCVLAWGLVVTQRAGAPAIQAQRGG
jgi:hypothetical protein